MTEQYVLPIPKKENATIYLPESIDMDDWIMIDTMIRAVVEQKVRCRFPRRRKKNKQGAKREKNKPRN